MITCGVAAAMDLYRKPRDDKIVCAGVKSNSCLNAVKNYTNRFLLFYRFRKKSIVWPTYDVPFRSHLR